MNIRPNEIHHQPNPPPIYPAEKIRIDKSKARNATKCLIKLSVIYGES